MIMIREVNNATINAFDCWQTQAEAESVWQVVSGKALQCTYVSWWSMILCTKLVPLCTDRYKYLCLALYNLSPDETFPKPHLSIFGNGLYK